ncbi:MAG: hypothetical protein R3204_12420 [Oceanospirillum sp.]|nr:hypothetical protein [Oceanospirillum sp.]
MTIASYLNQLLREGKFWFLKESAMDLWLISRNPAALPYLAAAYFCMDDSPLGQHWLQQSRQNLAPGEQKELAHEIGGNAPANVAPKVTLLMSKLSA